MGKKGEFELINILKKHGMNCIHSLTQKDIADSLKGGKDESIVLKLLEKNKELPRKRLTMEVDVFSWKDAHWGALAIEQKSQKGSPKTLSITDELRLYSSKVELWRGGEELILQCKGAGYLGSAFAVANKISARVVPVGVVEYNIKVFDTPVKWAFYDGVFFVNLGSFEEFVEAFLERKGWVHDIATTTTAD